jgi:outer membrane lipoprotein-sorting protein
MKLEDILAKNFKASGQDKLGNMSTTKMTMNISQEGMTFSISMLRKHPNLLRTETEVQGTKIIYAFDGQNGWMINPAAGTLDPQDMPADMVKDFDDKTSTLLNWNNPFFNWKEEGNKIELVGLEDMNGIQVYNIKITYKDNEVMNYYIDAAKFVVLKEKSTETYPGQEVVEEDVYSDFREVEGVVVPFKFEVLINGQSSAAANIDKVEFNLPLEDTIFKKPVPENK